MVAFFGLRMFEEVYNILNKAIALDESDAFVFVIDATTRSLIIDLNTEFQLGEEGIDSIGDDLGEYANFTIVKRSELGLQTDHIDFKVTGEYWASWRVTVNGEFFEILVDQERFDELVNDLGFAEEHVGLTNDSLDVLTRFLIPKYQNYVRMKLGI